MTQLPNIPFQISPELPLAFIKIRELGQEHQRIGDDYRTEVTILLPTTGGGFEFPRHPLHPELCFGERATVFFRTLRDDNLPISEHEGRKYRIAEKTFKGTTQAEASQITLNAAVGELRKLAGLVALRWQRQLINEKASEGAELLPPITFDQMTSVMPFVSDTTNIPLNAIANAFRGWSRDSATALDVAGDINEMIGWLANVRNEIITQFAIINPMPPTE